MLSNVTVQPVIHCVPIRLMRLTDTIAYLMTVAYFCARSLADLLDD